MHTSAHACLVDSRGWSPSTRSSARSRSRLQVAVVLVPHWCHALPSLPPRTPGFGPGQLHTLLRSDSAAHTPAAQHGGWGAAGSPCQGRPICSTASTPQEECERIIAVGGKHGFQRSMAGDGVQSVRTPSTSLLTMACGYTDYSHTNYLGTHLVDLVVLARCVSERPNHADHPRADRKPDHGGRSMSCGKRHPSCVLVLSRLALVGSSWLWLALWWANSSG